MLKNNSNIFQQNEYYYWSLVPAFKDKLLDKKGLNLSLIEGSSIDIDLEGNRLELNQKLTVLQDRKLLLQAQVDKNESDLRNTQVALGMLMAPKLSALLKLLMKNKSAPVTTDQIVAELSEMNISIPSKDIYRSIRECLQAHPDAFLRVGDSYKANL